MDHQSVLDHDHVPRWLDPFYMKKTPFTTKITYRFQKGSEYMVYSVYSICLSPTLLEIFLASRNNKVAPKAMVTAPYLLMASTRVIALPVPFHIKGDDYRSLKIKAKQVEFRPHRAIEEVKLYIEVLK